MSAQAAIAFDECILARLELIKAIKRVEDQKLAVAERETKSQNTAAAYIQLGELQAIADEAA